MQENAKDIVAVLMSEGELSLSGLGTFSLVDQTASVNIIEGQSKPPSKRAVFNPNLQLDDGRLFRYWVQQKGLTQEQAQKRVSDLLTYIKNELGKEGAIQIPGLGRLFQDHTQEMRFTSSEQNLSTSSFGLGAVPIAPVVRTERPASYPSAMAGSSAAAAKKASPLPTEHPLARLWLLINRYIWHIAAATAIFFMLGLWYVSSRGKQPAVAINTNTLVERAPRVGAPPPIEQALAVQEAEEKPTAVGNIAEEASTTIVKQNELAEHSASRSIEDYALIAVGRYGRAANIDKMVARIEAAGYSAYTKKESGLTRVGVEYSYRNENDLDEALTAIRRQFSQDAFIVSRNKRQD